VPAREEFQIGRGNQPGGRNPGGGGAGQQADALIACFWQQRLRQPAETNRATAHKANAIRFNMIRSFTPGVVFRDGIKWSPRGFF
jgi:hypothetical protein